MVMKFNEADVYQAKVYLGDVIYFNTVGRTLCIKNAVEDGALDRCDEIGKFAIIADFDRSYELFIAICKLMIKNKIILDACMELFADVDTKLSKVRKEIYTN